MYTTLLSLHILIPLFPFLLLHPPSPSSVVHFFIFPALTQGLKARFTAAAGRYGGVVVEEFLDAAALGEIYAASLLNVHPCSYDAYGMTVVEAAAFGTPSAVQGGDRVGAAAGLLKEQHGEFVPVDLLSGVGQDPETRARTFADAVEVRGTGGEGGSARKSTSRTWGGVKSAAL